MEKERKLTESEMAEIAAKVAADPAYEAPSGYETGMTRAPEGASFEEVHQGMLPAPESETYAEDGSLARALREEEEKRKVDRAERADKSGEKEKEKVLRS